MTDPFEIIDAFVDGEPTDVVALRAVLTDRDTVEYFIDALKLRVVLDEDPLPAQSNRFGRHVAGRFGLRSWLVPTAAAIFLVGGAFTAGRWQAGTTTTGDSTGITAPAPRPDRIVEPQIGKEWIETPVADATIGKEG